MRVIVLSILAGILFALALPPFDVEGLGWVALAPLLVAVAMPGRRVLHAVGLGLLTGIATGVVQVRSFEQQGFPYAVLPFVWIGLALAFVAGIAAFMRPRLAERPVRWILFVAMSGVAVEWLTTFSPLPVGVSLCQFRTLPVLQLASLTGMWGVSFLLYMANATVADVLLRRRFEKRVHLPVLAAVMGAVLVGFALQRHEQAQPRQTRTVAAVQDYTGGDVPPSEHALSTGYEPDNEHLMRDAAAQGAELIVGTEKGIGGGFTPNDPNDSLAQLAREKQTHLVVGYEGRDEKGARNVASLIAPTGRTVASHNKVKLFLGERTLFVAGEGTTVTDTTIGRIGLFLCFDTCFPTLVRQAALQKVQLLAVPNYDPPTPNAILHRLHGAILPFRAVENRIVIVRADPNGNSQIIAPSGQLLAEGPFYRAVPVVASVPLGDGSSTLYTRFGDWFVYGCIAGILVLGFSAFRKNSPAEH